MAQFSVQFHAIESSLSATDFLMCIEECQNAYRKILAKIKYENLQKTV